MNPLRLYIENFYCHEQSFIDFTQFDSALIIASINDNEDYSNGAGKTSIFKAIEYVLFNETSSKLDTIIRDDTDYCRIVFDFEKDNNIYRVCRKKTKKNNDLTFLKKINNDDTAIHEEDPEGYHKATDALELKDHWENLTSTRGGDTEKKLFSIIKTNYKFFCNTSHFIQNNISGLATTSPEKRRQLLKESLDLVIYSNLEKEAKALYNNKTKELDRINLSIDHVGNDIDKKIIESKNNIDLNNKNINDLNIKINDIILQENNINDLLIKQKEELAVIKNTVENSLLNKNKLIQEINELNNKNKDLKRKSSLLKDEASNVIKQINNLQNIKNKNSIVDISSLEATLSELNQALANQNAIVSSNVLKYEELNVPIPNEDSCKHCRQIMTPEHKKNCLENIQKEINICKNNISTAKHEIKDINAKISNIKSEITQIKINNEKLLQVDNEISQKKNLLNSKHKLYEEYKSFLKDNELALSNKNNLLEEINLAIDQNSLDKIMNLEDKIKDISLSLSKIINDKNSLLKQKSHSENAVAVLKHQISKFESELITLSELKLQKEQLQKDLEQYPNVIQAFGNKGIPNLIIQNLLDELQFEANELLSKLKPGLQLQFVTTKENSDDDTLDIHYFVNNRKRYYQQLSGAMQICVMFALKLGWSFLLQNKFDFNTSLLLLDEIDQALDRAGINAFVDIVKYFQQKFKILIITHNDKLKTKLSNIICVYQDKDKISKAKLS